MDNMKLLRVSVPLRGETEIANFANVNNNGNASSPPRGDKLQSAQNVECKRSDRVSVPLRGINYNTHHKTGGQKP